MANDVELNDRRAVYIASAGQTVFDIDFPILSEDDVAVFQNGIELDTADYVVDTDLLTVTLDTAAALNDSIVIDGDTAPVRTSSYPKSGALLSSVLNNDMRRFVYLAQELLTKVSRAVSLAQDESSGISQRLPKAETGKMLKWGAVGLENSTSNIDNIDDAVAAAEAAQAGAELASSAATTAKTQAQAALAAAEAAAAGMKWRPSVKVATTANITLSGAQTIDGVAVVAGDRVLVKDQTTASQNGVYVVASGSWARATDADSWAELVSQVVAVEQGTANADYTFICTVDQGGTIGTTAVTWSTFKVIIPDGGVSTAAKIVSGILNYAHHLASEFASVAELVAGTAQKLVDAATAKLTYLIQLQNTVVPTNTATVDLSTSIPDNIRRLTINYYNIRTNGTSPPIIQLGDTAFVVTGYQGSCMNINNSGTPDWSRLTTGFQAVRSHASANVIQGRLVFERVDPSSHEWTMSGNITADNGSSGALYSSAGSISLGARLQRVRAGTVGGTDLYLAQGKFGISWEY